MIGNVVVLTERHIVINAAMRRIVFVTYYQLGRSRHHDIQICALLVIDAVFVRLWIIKMLHSPPGVVSRKKLVPRGPTHAIAVVNVHNRRRVCRMAHLFPIFGVRAWRIE
ncbi:MAG: hypothetical protein CMA64_08495 [Euryarchaeota archaeon]|nr:hypothetical protein [Euryarchaeota archaeon]